MNHSFLAFDIGASSGRAILGTLKDSRLELTEVHRFANQMMHLHGHYFWNIFNLFGELKTGLAKCVKEFGVQPLSFGIDTWGVDYGLITPDGYLAGLPFAYRDHRTDQIMPEFFKIMDEETTYSLSGLQFMQFNTLFQLFASVKASHSALNIADSLLFTPDLLNFLFTGIRKNEYTIASTSALLKPGMAEWEPLLLGAAGIPETLVQEIIQPGTILGPLLPDVCTETGCCEIPCIAVASHDTASAVASVPALGERWAYISSGTWSLMGIESTVPLVSEKTRLLNFTNEGGVEGTTRFLKNIMGMWLIQECKKIWDSREKLRWEDIVNLSQTSQPFVFLIDPDYPGFLNPKNMPEAIQEFCRNTGQLVPFTEGQIARCIYDSLVLKYKFTLNQIEEVVGYPIEKIHVIGGGANNEFLCQLTADATGLPVFAGPVEATAIGNILIQAKALGYLSSIHELRQVVATSFDPVLFQPRQTGDWDQAYLRFTEIINKGKNITHHE
jgi:rhamnulokinase